MSTGVFPPQQVQQYEQLFTSSGTWTVPNGVKTVEVTVVGGSAGALSGNATISSNDSSAAGGYIKQILDISSIFSVPIIVGAAGTGNLTTPTAGGTSSFGKIDGTYSGPVLVANGSSDSTVTGSTIYGTASVVTTSNATLSSSLVWNKVRLINSRYFFSPPAGSSVYNTSTDSSTWTAPTGMGAVSNATYERIVYGNGYYVQCIGNTSTTNGTNDSAYYSTNGTSFTAVSIPFGTAGRNFSVAYGPAGFIASTASPQTSLSKPATTNDPSTTWSAYTPTGWTNTYAYLIGTSSRYYAFKTTTSTPTTTVYTSTNGTSWTSFTTTGTPTGASPIEVINDIVYYIHGGVIYSISGTTTTTVNSSSSITWTKLFSNGYATNSDGSAIYDISNSKIIFSTQVSGTTIQWISQNSYWTIPSTASTTLTKYDFSSLSIPNTITIAGISNLYDTTKSTPGAGGGGSFSYATCVTSGTSSQYALLNSHYLIPGDGIEDWAWGATSYKLASQTSSMTYTGPGWERRTFGSGAAGKTTLNDGNQGVVRLRWWS